MSSKISSLHSILSLVASMFLEHQGLWSVVCTYLLLLCSAAFLIRLLLSGGLHKLFKFSLPCHSLRACPFSASACTTHLRPSSPLGENLFGGASHKLNPSDDLLPRLQGVEAFSSSQREAIELLLRSCCAVPVVGAKTSVLDEPSEFYRVLCNLIREAEEGVTLCALYIGSGPLAQGLVDAILERIQTLASKRQEGDAAAMKPFRVRMVMDYHRMRDGIDLLTMKRLLEVVNPSDASNRYSFVRVEAYLYQHPCSWTRWVYPLGRAAEGLGVQHAKIFCVDDRHIILTGANLSDDYFSTRTDRYFVIRDSPLVGAWFNGVCTAIADVSHPVLTLSSWRALRGSESGECSPMLEPKGPLRKLWFSTFHAHQRLSRPLQHRVSSLLLLPNQSGFDPALHTERFIEKLRSRLILFAEEMRQRSGDAAVKLWKTCDGGSGAYDTLLFPTIQCGPAGVVHDSRLVERLLCLAGRGSNHLYLTSPYMNLYGSYMDEILKHRASLDCVTASVKANSWNNIKGARFIPQSYLQLQRRFLYLCKDFNALNRIQLHEYGIPGRTFHSKGLWIVDGEKKEASSNVKESSSTVGLPYLIGIGSTNFGYRSVNLDFEAASFVYTENSVLRNAFRGDLVKLLKQSTRVEERNFVGDAAGRFQPIVSLVAQLAQGHL